MRPGGRDTDRTVVLQRSVPAAVSVFATARRAVVALARRSERRSGERREARGRACGMVVVVVVVGVTVVRVLVLVPTTRGLAVRQIGRRVEQALEERPHT